MKKNILLFIIIIFSSDSFAQKIDLSNAKSKADTLKLISNYLKVQLEHYCPYYVVENYCEPDGMDIILKKLKTDERVNSITRIAIPLSKSTDSSLIVNYQNTTIIAFEIRKGEHQLPYFYVNCKSAEDLYNFSGYYSTVMGFIEDKSDKEVIRFYSELAPMNAVFGKRKPYPLPFASKAPYWVTCFVEQWELCGQ